MSANALEKLRETEKQAEEIKKEALVSAADIIAKAKADAEVLLAEEHKKAVESVSIIISNEEEKARNEVAKEKEILKSEIEAIKILASEKLEYAAELVLERIIRADGNS